MSRPLLSIIIPCYNSKKYITRTLDSIVATKEATSMDMEIILVDDLSDEDYSDEVEPFKDKLNIIQLQNSYRCGSPTNGRELGASKATGEYITFMDHDDTLDPEGMRKWKMLVTVIWNKPEYVVAGFRNGFYGKPETFSDRYGCLLYLHGKFFNTDKFYRKADIHFKPDMYYLEDQYLCALTSCSLVRFGFKPVFADFCTYNWLVNEGSLGEVIKNEEEINNNDQATYDRMKVYVDTNRDTLLRFYYNGWLPDNIAKEWLLRTIVQMYIESQCLHKKFDVFKDLIIDCTIEIKDALKLSNKKIVELVYADDRRILSSEVFQAADDHDTIEIIESFEDYINKYIPEKEGYCNDDSE